jgi:two-component system repressor protein LuxO
MSGVARHMAFVRPQSGPIGVVIVDADPGQRRALSRIIADSGGRFAARPCPSPEEAKAAVAADPEAIVIADLETLGGAGEIGKLAGGARLIATSASGSLHTAIAAVKGGAHDFLPKPIGAKALIERLEATLAGRDAPGARATARPPAAAAPPAHADGDFAGFIGRSPAMEAVYEQIRRMAPSRAPIFVTGESGTGKELCAEAIHAAAFGDAGTRPFVAINCSAIPRELMESEIFGHVRGAFTGAAGDRAGAAELAHGGTLLLDEIGEMDLSLQAKLLRFVQTGTIRRVGGNGLIPVEVRIVCATNRDPAAEVAAGRFRADLFFRLHVLPIELPPLRQRGEDVLRIARQMLTRFADEEGRQFTGFDEEAEARLAAYAWPGNVRELANVIRRIVVLHDGQRVGAAMLPAGLRGEAGRALTASAIAPFHEEERRVIERALAAFGGNIARAAAALQISPATIYRKKQGWAEQAAAG